MKELKASLVFVTSIPESEYPPPQESGMIKLQGYCCVSPFWQHFHCSISIYMCTKMNRSTIQQVLKSCTHCMIQTTRTEKAINLRTKNIKIEVKITLMCSCSCSNHWNFLGHLSVSDTTVLRISRMQVAVRNKGGILNA